MTFAKPTPPPNLMKLLPWVETVKDPEFVFGNWAGGEQRNGAIQAPYFAFSDDALRFLDDVSAGNWVRPEINWSGEPERGQFFRMRDNPAAIEVASVEEIALLLTTFVRGDRFNEGILAKAFEDRVIERILARVQSLAMKPL